MQTGVRGYVLKSAPIEDLIKAIETVQAGQTFFSPEVARIALNQFVRGTPLAPGNSNLTPREREVLTWIAEGLSSKEIANCLGVGVRTVETHRERLMRKLNIHSIAGLTKFALVNGLAAIPKD
jgi:DNA-binding NarL/FixJ family response regulator